MREVMIDEGEPGARKESRPRGHLLSMAVQWRNERHGSKGTTRCHCRSSINKADAQGLQKHLKGLHNPQGLSRIM